MATQLSKFTSDNKASIVKLADIEQQSKNYKMNLDNLLEKVQKLDEQIHQATPIMLRMKKEHEIMKEQYQEAKRKMLSIQLDVNTEENEIVEMQTRCDNQKKKIQTIVDRIGKTQKEEYSAKSPRVREKKKKSRSDPLTKEELLDIQESSGDGSPGSEYVANSICRRPLHLPDINNNLHLTYLHLYLLNLRGLEVYTEAHQEYLLTTSECNKGVWEYEDNKNEIIENSYLHSERIPLSQGNPRDWPWRNIKLKYRHSLKMLPRNCLLD